MDLPPSGWYPDPYGVPDLLRWWDGATWTQHTHPVVGTAEGGGSYGGRHAAGGAGGAQATAVQATAVQSTAVQSTAVQPTAVQPTTVQGGDALSGAGLSGGGLSDAGLSGGALSGAGGWGARDRVIGDWAGTDWPTGDQLANTMPPKGPRTEPQPALPEGYRPDALLPGTSVQSSVQPTTYQPAAEPNAYERAIEATSQQSAAQATRYQPAVAPTAYQPTAYQPTAHGAQFTGGQFTGGQFNAGGGAAGGPVGDGTQVLPLGADAWAVPGAPETGNRYGYQRAQHRRRLWLIGGVLAGTTVAIAVIVVVATSLGKSGNTPTADQAASTPPAAPTAAATTLAASPTPTTSASASASASAPTAVLSDGESGLSYSQLGTPWSPTCPSDLNSAFPWTAGESAEAGEINNGSATWYGEACSGPLPAQYNYTGVPDLDNTATNLAQTLENAYYGDLNHTVSPILSQPVTVSGHPGWEVEYQMNYTNAAAQGATWTTEEGAVVVTDTGTGNTPVVFFTSIPNTLNTSNVATLLSSLSLTVVPSLDTASPTATASASASASGTPTATASATTSPTGANP